MEKIRAEMLDGPPSKGVAEDSEEVAEVATAEVPLPAEPIEPVTAEGQESEADAAEDAIVDVEWFFHSSMKLPKRCR